MIIRIRHLLVLEIMFADILPYTVASTDRTPKSISEQCDGKKYEQQCNINHFIVSTVDCNKHHQQHENKNKATNLAENCKQIVDEQTYMQIITRDGHN
ncbi:hypothetical protein BLOT_007445 [Blomia tropicalis]|nr:hypothetical protein BLOT_007445 [Blomia tropicalis]